MKLLKKLFFTIIFVLIIVVAFFVKKGYDEYIEAINNMSIEEKIAEIKQNENYTTYDQLPQDYINAVVAVEDKRFFKHSGVDIIQLR